jgi:hypothetical protein
MSTYEYIPSIRMLHEVLKSVHDSDCRFWAGKNILKNMMFRDVTTVLNERKHLKMVIRSVPDSVILCLILDRTE